MSEEYLPRRTDAVAVLHVVGASVEIVNVETPGVVLGVKTFVGETCTKFKASLVRNGISFRSVSKLITIHHAHASKNMGRKSLAQDVGIGEFGSEVEVIEIEIA